LVVSVFFLTFADENQMITIKTIHMKKYFETYNGIQYPIREVDLSPILEGYGVERIADSNLSKVLADDTEGYSIEYGDATALDNSIYCYLDSGLIECDPADAEILLAIIRQEGEGQTDEQWYNLMQIAGMEIAQMYESKRINMNCEGCKRGGDYSVYAYNGRCKHPLYLGKSARQAAITMVNVLTTIRLLEM